MLRVLVANRIGPILLIAFTNHALDNIIAQVLDQDITNKVVRLGSRSANEAVGRYSLDEIMRSRPKERAGNQAYARMKDLQEELENLMYTMVRGAIETERLEMYLDENFPNHHFLINSPEDWVSQIFHESLEWEEKQKGRANVHRQPETLLEYWHQGRDLTFLTPPPEILAAGNGLSKRAKKRAKKALNQFSVLSLEDDDEGGPAPDTAKAPHVDPLAQWRLRLEEYFAKIPDQYGVPHCPIGNRALATLLDDPDVWGMSLPERQRLFTFWLDAAQEAAYTDYLKRFAFLKRAHHDARTEWNELMDKVCAGDAVRSPSDHPYTDHHRSKGEA